MAESSLRMKLLFRRLVQFVGILVLLLVLAVAVLHWYRPKVAPSPFPAPKPVSGAAVFYNQAFAAMPELSEEEEAFYKKVLKIKRSEPLDINAAKQLLAKYDASLQLVAKGVVEPQCEWGLDFSLGPSMQIPHIGKGIKLSQALGIRARLRLRGGDVTGATDDLLLMLRYAAHLGDPALIIGNLVKINSNVITIDLVTNNLQKFDPSSLQRLSIGITALPPAHSMREAVAMDVKTFAAYLRGLLAKIYAGESIESSTRNNELGADYQGVSTDAPIVKFMRAAPSLYLYMVHNYEKRGEELETLMGLPYVEGRPKLAAYEKTFETKSLMDPFSALALPALSSLRLKEVQIEAEWAILRTALEAQLHNPSELRARLAALRDPFDNGPIEMRDVEGGVELKLKSEAGKKSPTLIVGLPKK